MHPVHILYRKQRTALWFSVYIKYILIQKLTKQTIKVLAMNIRENQTIEGIRVNKTNIKLIMYADGLTGLDNMNVSATTSE